MQSLVTMCFYLIYYAAIICELALAIEQNPISAFVMGMWMGYVNDEGAFFNFDNTNPTRYDLLRARSVILQNQIISFFSFIFYLCMQ